MWNQNLVVFDDIRWIFDRIWNHILGVFDDTIGGRIGVTSNHFWVVFWINFGSRVGHFWVTFGSLLGHFGDHIGVTFCSLLGHFWIISGITLGSLLGHSWTLFMQTSGTFVALGPGPAPNLELEALDPTVREDFFRRFRKLQREKI